MTTGADPSPASAGRARRTASPVPSGGSWTTIVTARNFYGVLRVLEWGSSDASRHRTLMHGTIMHGLQYLAPPFNQQATTYYTATSGIGEVAFAAGTAFRVLEVSPDGRRQPVVLLRELPPGAVVDGPSADAADARLLTRLRTAATLGAPSA